MINYLLKILATLFVIAVMSLAFAGFVKADGVDDPEFYKENKTAFYQDFDYCLSSKENNMNTLCRKYDFMGPFRWQYELPREQVVILELPRQQASVPEPTILMLLMLPLVALFSYVVLRNTANIIKTIKKG